MNLRGHRLFLAFCATLLLCHDGRAEEKIAPGKEYQDAYSNSLQAFNKKEYDQALTFLNLAEKIQPGLPSTKILNGNILLRQRKFDEAQAIYQDLYAKDPNNIPVLFNLAECHFLKKEYADAKKLFLLFSQSNQGKQQTLGQYNVFLCDLLLGNDAEVRKTLTSLTPSAADPYYYFANAAYDYKIGNPDAARQYLGPAFHNYPLELSGTFADPLIELGYINLKKP